MKRRRRTRRIRLGSTAARFVEAKTEALQPVRGRNPNTSIAADEAVRLFTKARAAASCPVALGLFAEGHRQLGRLVAFIDDGGSGTLMRFKDSLMKASDAARATQTIITRRCFCQR
jgi:hypothetical protein